MNINAQYKALMNEKEASKGKGKRLPESLNSCDIGTKGQEKEMRKTSYQNPTKAMRIQDNASRLQKFNIRETSLLRSILGIVEGIAGSGDAEKNMWVL